LLLRDVVPLFAEPADLLGADSTLGLATAVLDSLLFDDDLAKGLDGAAALVWG
jgi:hypothetical protein